LDAAATLPVFIHMPEYCDPAELEELRQKLLWNGPPAPDGRFLSVFLDHNNKCNLRCRMCGFSDPRVESLGKYDLPRWAYDRIAAEAFPRAARVCLSLFTEPFMTRDFADRLASIPRYGVPFSEFYTNGTLLTDESIEKILDAQISRVTFSIDGGTKETFEAIRVGANFEQVIRNFRSLQARRRERGAALPRLRINHVLSEVNIDHFDQFLAMVEWLEAEEIVIRPVTRMSDAEIQENTDPVFWDKVRMARGEIAAFCQRTGVEDSGFLRDRPTRIDLDGMICRAPWTTLAVYPNGDVYPCMAWSRPAAGNLARQSFDEVWNGAAMTGLRAEFESKQPGIDCLHCTIRRAADDGDDDFFYRKLAAAPLPFRSAAR
jgi:radical SAM protein with 4Fe4S-binding SPASM domain